MIANGIMSRNEDPVDSSYNNGAIQRKSTHHGLQTPKKFAYFGSKAEIVRTDGAKNSSFLIENLESRSFNLEYQNDISIGAIAKESKENYTSNFRTGDQNHNQNRTMSLADPIRKSNDYLHDLSIP